MKGHRQPQGCRTDQSSGMKLGSYVRGSRSRAPCPPEAHPRARLAHWCTAAAAALRHTSASRCGHSIGLQSQQSQAQAVPKGASRRAQAAQLLHCPAAPPQAQAGPHRRPTRLHPQRLSLQPFLQWHGPGSSPSCCCWPPSRGLPPPLEAPVLLLAAGLAVGAGPSLPTTPSPSRAAGWALPAPWLDVSPLAGALAAGTSAAAGASAGTDAAPAAAPASGPGVERAGSASLAAAGAPAEVCTVRAAPAAAAAGVWAARWRMKGSTLATA